MEGAHDLGGMGGFGAVRTPDGDLTHHEDWELRAQWLALAACRGARPWVERIDTPTYLTTPYYARWLLAGEAGAIAHGLVTQAELTDAAARVSAGAEPQRIENADRVAAVERMMTTPEPIASPSGTRFAVGDRVIPKRMHEPAVHHRCPRYVRGVTGVVERVCGNDRLAGYRQHDVVEPVYTVRFDSTDVFGARPAEPAYAIHIDLWQSYLDPAAPTADSEEDAA